MAEQRRLYLVLYDISDPRRWRKVYARLKARGAWAQLSAFFCRLDPAQRDCLEAELRDAIDARCDRLLIVDLGDADRALARITNVGNVALPSAPQAATF